DPATDIAVIKADTTRSLTPIALGSSATLDEGQAVAAVGSPLGLSGTVTTGIISALNRPVRAGGEQSDQSTVIDAIQTDAAVNPGNSGGALVNMNGELVGINSAIASLGSGNSGSIGLGFAIPVDQARRIADQLIKQGYATRAVLGVSVSDAPDTDGALVRATEPGGPAERAGIRDGAVIVKVGDRVTEGGDALVAAIRSRAPGDTVSVTYAARVGDQPTTVDVVLGEAR
ncbi:MAG TPA: trypsin-like peptidase domain-containing protein, partial [Dietzia sp.]|nr:trypsin-like peptidase domain-containing protein [Dietzia sp.]